MSILAKIEEHRIRDRLFDFAWIVLILALILNLTAWDGLDHTGRTEAFLRIMRIASLIVFAVVILLNFLSRQYKARWIAFYACLAIIFGLSWYFSKSSTLLIFFVVFAAAYKQDSRRLVTLSAIISGGIIFLNILGSYLGFSVNYLFGEGTRPRYGLGFSWATSAAILFFFFILQYIYLRKERMRWFEFAILEGVNLYLFLMTDSRMAFTLATAFIVFFFIENLFKNHFRVINKVRWIMVFLPMLFGAISIAAALLYSPDEPFWVEINHFINKRLQLSYDAIHTYDVTVFGNPIQWVGYDINNLTNVGYNYVDCSYMQILLQFGVASACACVAVYCLGVWRALKAKDGYLACVFVIIAFFSITEPRFMNLAFNVFPVLAFAKLNPEKIEFKKGWFKNIFISSFDEEEPEKHELTYIRKSDYEYETPSIRKNFIMNTLLSVSSFIFPLITFPYVSRVLGPSGTGPVDFAFSIVGYFCIISQLGIPTYGIRACAKARDDKLKLSRTAHELFFINIITTVISCILLVIAISVVPEMREEKTLFLIVGLTIILSAIGMEWLYRGLEQYTYITIRTLVFKTIAAIAMFLLIKSEDDYIIYGAIAVFSGSASLILNFIHARKLIMFKWLGGYDLKKHIKPSFTFFALACATTIYTNLDSGMLGFMRDNTEVGLYNAAVKIKAITLGIITSLGAVLLPRASYYVERGLEKEFEYLGRKSLNFVCLLATPVFIYFIIFAKEGITALSGDLFADAVVPMQIIMPTVFFIGITNILGFQILTPMDKENVVLWSVCAGAAADIIMNLILIPRMGASGAAIGTLVAEFVVLVFQLIVLRNSDKMLFSDVKYKKILIALITGVVVSFWVKYLPFNNFVNLAISAILFFASYYAMLMILKEPFVKDISHQVAGKLKKIAGK